MYFSKLEKKRDVPVEQIVLEVNSESAMTLSCKMT